MFREVIFIFLLLSPFVCTKKTLVHTKNGKLRGRIDFDRNGKEYVAFLGVPYAKPPVGDLRFRAPLPVSSWHGIRDAITDVPACPQNYNNAPIGQEDCLYMNIFTPKVTNEIRKLKSVMVYIHGGSLIEGSAAEFFFGPQFLITEDVVLVVINYRLGVLGLLSLENKIDGFSSNNAIRDQILALKWLKDNIREFGGNPNDITIFGESAGGVSVHFLILSPLSKGLFHKAISQSGTVFPSWSIGTNNSAIEFAEALNISTTDLSKMIQKLRQLPIEEILKAQLDLNFLPTFYELHMGSAAVEGPGPDSVLPYHPREIINSGKYSKVPYINGYNNQEGILYDVLLRRTGTEFVFNVDVFIPYDFDQNRKSEIRNNLMVHYWNNAIPTTAKEVIDIYTDVCFKYAAVRPALDHAKYQNNAYLYEFSMDTELNYFKRTDPVTATYPGASHLDELGYLFNATHTPLIKPGSVEDISLKRMIRLWTNFAKYGNPTPRKEDLLQNQIWLPVNENKLHFMSLGANLEAKLYKDAAYDFWDKLYKEYDTLGTL